MLGRSQVGKARDFDSRMRRFESCRPSHFDCIAGVAELADALDLGSSAARRGSSSLFARTKWNSEVEGLKSEILNLKLVDFLTTHI